MKDESNRKAADQTYDSCTLCGSPHPTATLLGQSICKKCIDFVKLNY